MDYFEEGKKNQKDFSKFDASVSHAFEKYVFDFVLKDKHEKMMLKNMYLDYYIKLKMKVFIYVLYK